jgi:hypothetical protein
MADRDPSAAHTATAHTATAHTASDQAATDQAATDQAATDHDPEVRPHGDRTMDDTDATRPMRADDLSDGELDAELAARDRHSDGTPGDAAHVVPETDIDGATRAEMQEGSAYVVDDGVATDEGEEAPVLPSTVEPQGALWAGVDTQALRERWRDVQLRFVDDPRSAADDAAALVDEAAQTLIAAIESRRSALTEAHPKGRGPAQPGAPEDPRPEGETEQLRVSVQRYREFLDQVMKL